MLKIKEFAADFGWPRIIIFFFLITLFIVAPFVGVSISMSLSDTLNRFGQNAILVLALVPMVQAGCGLNFGLPVGIIAGLLGATIAMQIGLTGWFGFFGAVAICLPIAAVFGWLYGQGRGDDDSDVRRFLAGNLLLHPVASFAVFKPGHGLGLYRQGTADDYNAG